MEIYQIIYTVKRITILFFCDELMLILKTHLKIYCIDENDRRSLLMCMNSFDSCEILISRADIDECVHKPQEIQLPP